MDKKEFIIECAMRNLAAMFGNGYWSEAESIGPQRAYDAAAKLAEILMENE